MASWAFFSKGDHIRSLSVGGADGYLISTCIQKNRRESEIGFSFFFRCFSLHLRLPSDSQKKKASGNQIKTSGL